MHCGILRRSRRIVLPRIAPLMTFQKLRRIAATAALAIAPLTGQAVDLTVSAAASLSNAFRALGPIFEAQNPLTTVVFNFAASDSLLAQIARGAPVDVFAAADSLSMDRAERQRLLVANSRRDFVANTLVLVTPVGNALHLTSLADLQRLDVKRVAIGNPAGVPAGRYTQAALEAAGLWSAVQPKAVFAHSVRQALDYVARGEVDAGVVYATDAAILKDRVSVAATIATRTPIAYPVATIAGSPNPEAARRFVDFLLAPPAQAVLARFGFGRP